MQTTKTDDSMTLERMDWAFRKAFPGVEPKYLSRSPGRVNLIGEHTDYNDLPVLPMALQREVQVLFAPREDTLVRILNLDEEFGRREFNVSTLIPPEPEGDWGNYLKAACQALARRYCGLLNEGDGDGLASVPKAYQGFDAVLTTTLPIASGLSSSSALVISMGQAMLVSNGLEMSPLSMAVEMARGERYTGTQGGGMDQAICLGAQEGHATRIEFSPLRLTHTPVPKDWRFIVAHTLIRAEKSGRAQEAYNARTKECKRALDQMGPAAIASGLVAEGEVTYPGLVEAGCVEDLLELGQRILSNTLQKRFRHVITEGNRVYDAEHALKREDRHTFGLLMNASHQSLKDDYQVSCHELDTLVRIATEAGADGARLTGAGFGGSAVVLTDASKVEEVYGALAHGYYDGHPALTGGLDQALFVAEPSGGASVGKI